MMLLGSHGCRTRDYAASLNGSTQCFRFTDSADWAFGSGSGALAIWVYPTGFAAAQAVFAQWDFGLSQRAVQLSIDATTGVGRFTVSSNGTSSTAVTGTALTPNAWNLLVGVIDKGSNEIKVSVNGAAFSAVAFSSAIFNPTCDLTIGCNLNSNAISSPLTGRVSRSKIWKGYALTQSDVTYLHNGGYYRTAPEVQAALPTGLVSYVILSNPFGAGWGASVGPTPTVVGSPSGSVSGVRGP